VNVSSSVCPCSRDFCGVASRYQRKQHSLVCSACARGVVLGTKECCKAAPEDHEKKMHIGLNCMRAKRMINQDDQPLHRNDQRSKRSTINDQTINDQCVKRIRQNCHTSSSLADWPKVDNLLYKIEFLSHVTL
jgi:hypothetical protein